MRATNVPQVSGKVDGQDVAQDEVTVSTEQLGAEPASCTVPQQRGSEAPPSQSSGPSQLTRLA